MIFPLWPSGPPVLDGIDSPQNNAMFPVTYSLCYAHCSYQGKAIGLLNVGKIHHVISEQSRSAER